MISLFALLNFVGFDLFVVTIRYNFMKNAGNLKSV